MLPGTDETAKVLTSGSFTASSFAGDPLLLVLSDKSWYVAVDGDRVDGTLKVIAWLLACCCNGVVAIV